MNHSTLCLQLLRSGHLLPLESLHHTPTVKGLGDPQSRSDSPAISTSPLVLGPNTRPGDWFSSGAATTTISTTAAPGAATLDTSTIVALATPSARDRQAGLSGGIWPSSPCLIFASHPSLRFGSVVHLIRALAYGDLRPGTRTAQAGTPAPRHSIILVESGDYIYSPTTLGPARCLQHLLSPYILRSSDKSSDTICSTSQSPTGVPTCDLSETATVFWLPMEARLGPEELPHLLSRCRSPRLTLCLPTEMAPYLVESLSSCNFTTHYIAAGQKLRLPTLGSQMQPVRLSAQLVRHLRPVHVTDPHSKSVKTTTKGQSDPRTKPGILAKSDVSTTILSSDHDQTLPSGSKRISAPSTDSTEPDIKRFHKMDTNVVQSSVENSCLALVDGLLTSRDGKYWLNDPRELESSGTSRFSSNRTVRPSTPPIPAALAGRRGEDEVKSSGQSIKSDNRVFVSHIPRIEPFRLIKELTERGVTGAYLADKSMVSHIAQRFPTRDHCESDAANAQSADYILFPNPNTVIQLADHSSHILTADEGTRATIRDSILSCLLQLETRSANSLTGISVIQVGPLPLEFPCLGLGNLAVSQPSCFLHVAWQLGTERVLQLNDFKPLLSVLFQVPSMTSSTETIPMYSKPANLSFEQPLAQKSSSKAVVFSWKCKYITIFYGTRRNTFSNLEGQETVFVRPLPMDQPGMRDCVSIVRKLPSIVQWVTEVHKPPHHGKVQFLRDGREALALS
ncbi:hypothetical protein T265_08430 [Opisthorchis viverrini]|uniref:Uncharacterized protein n=1 Tax=Opisthorchis viverrini TaxID=6198 RepID=A0A075A8F3_OPIVI|nr:hypothetical protein T265_08430 [Opisthorchis viverrini]KER23739.1 hypothetical protein T265_08430 [Opisthorchis viverrini]